MARPTLQTKPSEGTIPPAPSVTNFLMQNRFAANLPALRPAFPCRYLLLNGSDVWQRRRQSRPAQTIRSAPSPKGLEFEMLRGDAFAGVGDGEQYVIARRHYRVALHVRFIDLHGCGLDG